MKYEVFLMGDQPTTCPVCGARTDSFMEYPDKAQLHHCMAENCHFEFIVVEE